MDSIKLTWQGKGYDLPVDMKTHRVIDRVLFRPEVQSDIATYGVLPPTDLAEIFAGLLARAGVADVTAEEVYRLMFAGGQDAKATAAGMVVIDQIIKLRRAPDELAADGGSGGSGRPSSRKPSRSR